GERQEGEHHLDQVAARPRHEGLHDHAEAGRGEDDQERGELEVLHGRVHELVHWSAPSSVAAWVYTAGGSSTTPKWLRMSSTAAGLITSSTGVGRNPRTTSATSSGATVATSRRSRSTTPASSCLTGAVMVRW